RCREAGAQGRAPDQFHRQPERARFPAVRVNTMNRVALVTGASRGLGECIARRLHAAGYRVGLADVRLDGVQRLAAQLDGSGASAVAIELDVRNKADFVRARDVLAERWGGTDILVNNAGVSKVAALMDITPE